MFTIVDTLDKMAKAQKTLKTVSIIALDLEASELNVKTAKLEGIGFGTGTEQFFIPYPNELTYEQVVEFLKDLFASRSVIFHNAKYDLKLLIANKLPTPKLIQDTMIMSWLVDEESQHGLKPLAKLILGKEPKKWLELDRTISLFRTEEDIMQELAEYCCEDVENTFKLYEHFLPLLVKDELMIDYERIELKLIPVLVKMELRGIKIDVSWLNQRAKEAEVVLKGLEEKIKEKLDDLVKTGKAKKFDVRGLNIRSPMQLEHILFEVLQYAVVKVTDKGKKSTDSETLELLVAKYKLTDEDVVPMLVKYRDLDKIYGTYLTALAEQAGLENVIHANFMQHGTRTGRLASNDPNLQNIPTRSDEWNVRSAFIPREGYKFLIADYSQIELRMLAHFSRDENMTNTFLEGGDIHAKTMELTGTNRHVAKGINFGLVYGMGPRTLAHTLKIKEEDAKKYIDRFFNGYPMVRHFIERVQQSAFKYGYVEMITGRRRRFIETRDQKWYGTIQRQSINTKIQGSAADLMKIAMIKLDTALKEFGAYQLVQIHDEIIVETPVDKIEETRKKIVEIMESALTLRVPIVANIVESERWVK